MVNTFILTNSPKECAKLLDYKRLGKQRVEAYQIVNIIIGEQKGFSNHPIAHVWKDHVESLKYYTNCMIDEWINRGYKNTMVKYDLPDYTEDQLPWWYKNKQLQYCNMASLARKDPKFYSGVFTFPSEYEHHGYIWMNKVKPEHLEKMKDNTPVNLDDICDPIGKGAPAHYRYTKEQTMLWYKNKLVNPITNRKIKKDGPLYKEFNSAYEHYK